MAVNTRSAHEGRGVAAGLEELAGVGDGRGVPATDVPHPAHRPSAPNITAPSQTRRRLDIRDSVNGGAGRSLRSS
jgi:hypothetical protein